LFELLIKFNANYLLLPKPPRLPPKLLREELPLPKLEPRDEPKPPLRTRCELSRVPKERCELDGLLKLLRLYDLFTLGDGALVR
jgi:hypothetical protein